MGTQGLPCRPHNCTILGVIWESCQNNWDLCLNYPELDKNMPLFHKTFQEYSFSPTVEQYMDSQWILQYMHTNVYM